MNKHNEISAGFSRRTSDRATKHGNWLRDRFGHRGCGVDFRDDRRCICAVQIDPDQRQRSHRHGDGADRKSEDVPTDTSFVDVVVGDPDIADVNPLTDPRCQFSPACRSVPRARSSSQADETSKPQQVAEGSARVQALESTGSVRRPWACRTPPNAACLATIRTTN